MSVKKFSFDVDVDQAGPVYGMVEMLRDLGVVKNFTFEHGYDEKTIFGECATCGSKHESIFGDTTQCSDMAATVYENGTIVGSYGSTEIDGSVWRFKEHESGISLSPNAVKLGNICDVCIRHLKTIDAIELVKDYFS